MPAPWQRRWHRWALATSALIGVGGLGIAIGPGAAWIVDHFADGQRVWRLGKLHLDGVSGSWLGDLRIAHAEIADDDGVWLNADNLSLKWRPQDLIAGAIHLDAAHVGALAIARQPNLEAEQPSSGAKIDVHIGTLTADSIALAEPVLGQTAAFTAELGIDLKGDAIRRADVAVRRTDSEADHLFVHYIPDQAQTLRLDVLGAPGGIIARSLGVADAGVSLDARGSGTAEAGATSISANIGDKPLVRAESHWTPMHWRTSGNAQLDLLPSLRVLTERIGASISFDASGANVGAFSAHAETPFLVGDISGALTDKHELDGGAQFLVSSQHVSAIAPESPFDLGPARVRGELRQARGVTAIHAQLLDGVVHAFGQTGHFSGPVQLSFSPERFSLTGDIRAPAASDPLFANARALTDLSFDYHRGHFALDRANYASNALVLDGRGWVNHGDGEFSGGWNIRDLHAATALTGGGTGQWRAFAAPTAANNPAAPRIWTTTVMGTGANIAGDPRVIPQLTGPAPHIDAMLKNEDGGITVSHARIDGDKIRAGATGRIVHGESNLTFEASARGPIDLGGASLDGALDATGRLTGRIERPAVSAHATLASFTSQGVVVDHPIVDLTLAPNGSSYRGHATAHGAVSAQPFTASADVASPGSSLQLTAIEAHAGDLTARGSANLAPHGVTADLNIAGSLNGLAPDLSGRVTSDVHLTPQNLTLNAQLADTHVGELHLHTASISAQGPTSAVAVHYAMQGGLRQAPLTFTGTAIVDTAHGGLDTHIQGEGTLAGEAVATRTPIHMHWSDHTLEAGLDVTLGTGALVADWTDHGNSLSGHARIDDAPLAPLAAIWGERASGRIDGHMTLANARENLSGDADITLTDARFVGRQRGTLNMHITGKLDPGRLAAQVDATSSEGLVAHLQADAPVVTDTSPIRIALAPQRHGSASWSVHGPAASLWAAARLQDQSLEGDLNGEGTLQFGAGALTGDGHIEIVNGKFEDKLTGIVLEKLNARVSIGSNGVNIDSFTAEGPDGGTLTATGGSASPNEGRIAIAINNMRVANRPDAHARASGNLELNWQGLHSKVSGELNLEEADLDIASNPETGIPTIDVVEINQPYNAANDVDEPVLTVPTSTDLDIRVRAPGRVSTRGRGLDAEWSLDMRLGGTSEAPLVYGEAHAIRGTLELSGQPFEIQDTSTITFDGAPLDARIDLVAIRETSDLTATIRLSGTARNPEVTLTSDPPLPDDEILPQVLFGHSVEDLSALEAAQLAASLAALSGRASLDILGAARAAVGLDRFSVRQDESGGVLVSGGVYLRHGVYLEIARNGLGQAQTRVEWTVRQHLLLITSFLGNGDQRVSLRWRRESN